MVKRSGFTLVELMLVCAILPIVAVAITRFHGNGRDEVDRWLQEASWDEEIRALRSWVGPQVRGASGVACRDGALLLASPDGVTRVAVDDRGGTPVLAAGQLDAAAQDGRIAARGVTFWACSRSGNELVLDIHFSRPTRGHPLSSEHQLRLALRAGQGGVEP